MRQGDELRHKCCAGVFADVLNSSPFKFFILIFFVMDIDDLQKRIFPIFLRATPG